MPNANPNRLYNQCLTVMKKVFRVARYVLLVLIFLITSGIVYEQLARRQCDRNRPAPEAFVTINGRKLHFHKAGKGAATVIFESGLGGDQSHWQDIQRQVAKNHVTLSYDRAGILWSDYTDDISLRRYEDDLSQLLEKTQCPKPFILVGHSFAGITLRQFIKKHIADIKGIVFIDVSHPRQLELSSEKLREAAAPPPSWLIYFLNETGALRLMYTLFPFTRSVPKDHWFNTHAADYFYKILPGLVLEMNNDRKLMKEAEVLTGFGDVPLYVLTARYPLGVERVTEREFADEYLGIHWRLQKDLLKLSSRSKQLFAEKSGHYITLQQPELIFSVIGMIDRVKE